MAGVYSYSPGRGWALSERCVRSGFTWEFEEELKLEFPSGTVVYCGRLKENIEGRPEETAGYGYFSSERRPYIERSYREAGRSGVTRIGDFYAVEHIRGNEYWLCDLQDVENEPGDYLIKEKGPENRIDITCRVLPAMRCGA